VVYRVRLDDFSLALDRVTAVVALIGAAGGLDEGARTRLRFCLYELTVNTVEHGVFAGTPAWIDIAVRISSNAIEVTYRDTAEPFATDAPAFVDVGRKIASGDKRGLGLFILNGMSLAFAYERTLDWNVTTITLENAPAGATHDERKSPMDGITVEMAPCDLEGTAILRPIGSVDSTTARVLESHLNDTIDRGKTTLVIDMSQVVFVSSAGVGVFLGTVSRLREDGGDLVFMRVPRPVAEVFDIINLGSYFRVIDDVGELAAVKES
jgi:anti-anti-sigma factor